MKTFFLRILVWSILMNSQPRISFSQTIPNGDFEDWSGSPEKPLNWGTLNTTTPFGSVITATKTTDNTGGIYAMNLVSQNIPMVGTTIPGLAICGSIKIKTTFTAPYISYEIFGFPFEALPTKLEGNWKYVPAGTDTAIILILLSKWDAIMQKRDTVAFGVKMIFSGISNYTPFTAPIIHVASGDPDTAMILISSSGRSPTVGSSLFVDDLKFTGGNVGVYELQVANSIQQRTYPNPAGDEINFITEQNISEIIIYDVTGRQVESLKSNIANYKMQTEKLTNGIYFYQLLNSNYAICGSGRFNVLR